MRETQLPLRMIMNTNDITEDTNTTANISLAIKATAAIVFLSAAAVDVVRRTRARRSEKKNLKPGCFGN